MNPDVLHALAGSLAFPAVALIAVAGRWLQQRRAAAEEEGKPARLAARLRVRVRFWVRRTQNRWYDLRAWTAGYCNDCPWRPEPAADFGGGYRHWRCGHRRGHEGMHRYRNYVWTSDGRVDYLPTPLNRGEVAQPWARNSSTTMRQTRQLLAWHRQQQAERAAARRAREEQV